MKTRTATAALAPLMAAALLVPAAEASAQNQETDDSGVVAEVPDEAPDLGDMESSYEVTADWGDGEVVTDISTGDDGKDDDADGSDKGDADDKGSSDGASDGKDDGSKDGSKDGGSKDGDKASEGSKDGDKPEGEECDVDAEAATAEKVVLVDGQGGADATVQTCEKSGDSYTEVKSYSGHVGTDGIAAPGAKVEGDGKTPSGTFDLSDGFGVKDKPSQFSGKYTQVDQDYVWIDGDASVEDGYNTMGRVSEGDKGESLAQTPAYNYAQVVDYNMDPVKAGAGSAIFLHVNTNSGTTAGCISLPESDLIEVFTWEADTDTQIQIVQ